jgi:hypothetical protein
MGSSATTETESAAARPCSGRISPMENCPDWLLALCAIASFVRPQPRLGERRHITARGEASPRSSESLPGIQAALRSSRRSGLLQHPQPCDRWVFEQCALTPMGRGIAKAVPLALWRNPRCRSLGPLPNRPVPSQDLVHQGKLAHGLRWGTIPHNRKPRFQTARCVHLSREHHCVKRAPNPRPEGPGPSRFSVARNQTAIEAQEPGNNRFGKYGKPCPIEAGIKTVGRGPRRGEKARDLRRK